MTDNHTDQAACLQVYTTYTQRVGVDPRDIQGLKEKSICLDDLYVKDKNNINLLYWAHRLGGQVILNYFYELAQVYFRSSAYNMDLEKQDMTRNIVVD